MSFIIKSSHNKCHHGNVEPPPYPGQYNVLQDWQKTWNREWSTDAVLPALRREIDCIERDWYYGVTQGKSKDDIKNQRLITEASIVEREHKLSKAEKKGTQGLFRRALRRIILTLHLDDLRIEYQELKKWRQERQKAANRVTIEADMKDEGDAPRWEGKMTFTMDPELYSQYMDTDSWFPFPTPANVRWYWVNQSGNRRLHGPLGPLDGRWGPAKGNEYRIPFKNCHGTIRRNVPENECRCQTIIIKMPERWLAQRRVY